MPHLPQSEEKFLLKGGWSIGLRIKHQKMLNPPWPIQIQPLLIAFHTLLLWWVEKRWKVLSSRNMVTPIVIINGQINFKETHLVNKSVTPYDGVRRKVMQNGLFACRYYSGSWFIDHSSQVDDSMVVYIQMPIWSFWNYLVTESATLNHPSIGFLQTVVMKIKYRYPPVFLLDGLLSILKSFRLFTSRVL